MGGHRSPAALAVMLCLTVPAAAQEEPPEPAPEATPEEVRYEYDESQETRVIRCSAKGTWCEPRASLLVTAHRSGTIELRDLPNDVSEIKIDAGGSGPDRPFSRSLLKNCKGKTAVSVDIYRKRAWLRYYDKNKGQPTGTSESSGSSETTKKSGFLAAQDEAEETCDRTRILVARNTSSSVDFAVRRGKDGPWEPLPSVQLEYQTWWIDLGGFYAFAPLSDEELTSEVVQPTSDGAAPMERILGISSGSDWQSRTGILATFFHANYPNGGVSFGISDSGGRSPSYYLGISLRLLGRKSAAVVTFTGGVLGAEVRRFRGLSRADLGLAATEDHVVPADSPLLNGVLDYEFEGFFAVTLQFALDPKGGKE